MIKSVAKDNRYRALNVGSFERPVFPTDDATIAIEVESGGWEMFVVNTFVCPLSEG